MLNLQRIKDRLAAYTSGSWAEHRIFRGPEATFVTLVQRDMTALVAEVERLRAEKAEYEADRLDCARQINDLSRKVEDLQHANISLKNTMDMLTAILSRDFNGNLWKTD